MGAVYWTAMPEELRPISDSAGEQPPAPSTANEPEKEDQIGDFITRQVLDKDTVFFEG
jgi:hypothetical protein